MKRKTSRVKHFCGIPKVVKTDLVFGNNQQHVKCTCMSFVELFRDTHIGVVTVGSIIIIIKLCKFIIELTN